MKLMVGFFVVVVMAVVGFEEAGGFVFYFDWVRINKNFFCVVCFFQKAQFAPLYHFLKSMELSADAAQLEGNTFAKNYLFKNRA